LERPPVDARSGGIRNDVAGHAAAHARAAMSTQVDRLRLERDVPATVVQRGIAARPVTRLAARGRTHQALATAPHVGPRAVEGNGPVPDLAAAYVRDA